MNILIPHTWLLEQLDTKVSPEDFQTYVSLSGPSVERIYDREGEMVYDIEVTTNRVDSMSVRGIAREASVILEQAGIAASLKPRALQPDLTLQKPSLPLPKIVGNPKLCKRTMAIVLSEIQRNATPDWMAQRLKQIDQKVHDSVIDITNYITHELGHPCHAFDYDLIMKLGGEIHIVEAKPNQEFITLDGEKHTTLGGEVVFTNQSGEIIDLPAIKGTANTSINESTKNVLLWVESIDAKKVRFASMKHAIRTVAAQLNEKKVDPNLATDVMHRGISLYQELCGAKIASELHDDFPGKKKPTTITLSLQKITEYLGLTLPVDQIISILTKLGCEASVQEKSLQVTPPTFRQDLVQAVDIIEEVARMYGYHNLPSTLMHTAIPMNKPTDTNFSLEHDIKKMLATLGWQEVYTYSMVSEILAIQSGLALSDHLKIANPLTDDRVYLRQSLLPSLAEVLDQNPQQPELSVFEIAHTYAPQPSGRPIENLELSLVSSKEYSLVRGDLELLLERHFVKSFRVVQDETANSGALASASVFATDAAGTEHTLGTLSVLPNQRVGVVLAFSTLLKVVNPNPTYQPIPKTTPVVEDLTFELPVKTHMGDVLETILHAHHYITKVELTSQYHQNATFRITYWDLTDNLSNERVEPVRSQLVATVVKTHAANLVGEI